MQPEIPAFWQVALLRHPGEPLELAVVRRPVLREDHVLVQVRTSGVCRSQLMEVQGKRGRDLWLPHLLGHEASGVVVEVGAAVSKVRIGDEVILGWIRGAGLDHGGTTLELESGEVVNAGPVATFAEYAVCVESRVYAKPPNLSEQEASWFGCAALTGGGMILHFVETQQPKSLLVCGLGGVGMAALLVAVALGYSVCVSDLNDSKLDTALEFGAVAAANPRKGSLLRQFGPAFSGGFDVAVEATGSSTGIEQAFDALHPDHGLLVFASHPPEGQKISLDPFALIRGRSISGAWGGGSSPDVDIPALSRILTDQFSDLTFLHTSTFRLDQVNAAIDSLERGDEVRPLLLMSDRSGRTPHTMNRGPSRHR